MGAKVIVTAMATVIVTVNHDLDCDGFTGVKTTVDPLELSWRLNGEDEAWELCRLQVPMKHARPLSITL